jgi:hypothetical protein
MQRKTLITLAAVFASACTLPALAQETPAQTNLNQAAAHQETLRARGSQLTDVTPEQAHANALRRCDNLPAFYKDDCEARVNDHGDNQVQGSVIGGGIFVETKTTMSEAEYNQQLAQSEHMQMLPPHSESNRAEARERHHRHPVHHKAKSHKQAQ